MSGANVRTLMAAASTAVEASDFSTARTKALAAKALLAGMPDGGRSGADLSWNRESIDTFIAQMDAELSNAAVAASGIRRSKVTYANPGSV